jgi:tRNA(fMet)-specific endonuclease VapC
MKCLDTDILVDILRNKHNAQEIVSKLDGEARHATTTVNAFELFYGANHSKNKPNNVEKVKLLLQRLDVLPLTLEASELAGEQMANLAAKGEIIEYRDAMIAGIVLELGLTLVTRNKKHFSRIPVIKLE